MSMERRILARMKKSPKIYDIRISGKSIRAVSPEGIETAMDLGMFARVVSESSYKSNNTDYVLPDGLKMVSSRGASTVWVVERPPAVYNFKWIANKSPEPFGRGAKYRSVRISLPYLIIIALFVPNENNKMCLSGSNECYFRTEPLKTDQDKLFFPSLLNCSKINSFDDQPISWICTSSLNPERITNEAENPLRMHDGLKTLTHCLLEQGFNLSSEYHEGQSWFQEYSDKKIDSRISSVEKWEKETAEDPLFVLNVPWIKTGFTLKEHINHVFDNVKAYSNRITSAGDVQRIIYNYGEPVMTQEELPLF